MGDVLFKLKTWNRTVIPYLTVIVDKRYCNYQIILYFMYVQTLHWRTIITKKEVFITSSSVIIHCQYWLISKRACSWPVPRNKKQKCWKREQSIVYVVVRSQFIKLHKSPNKHKEQLSCMWHKTKCIIQIYTI